MEGVPQGKDIADAVYATSPRLLDLGGALSTRRDTVLSTVHAFRDAASALSFPRWNAYVEDNGLREDLECLFFKSNVHLYAPIVTGNTESPSLRETETDDPLYTTLLALISQRVGGFGSTPSVVPVQVMETLYLMLRGRISEVSPSCHGSSGDMEGRECPGVGSSTPGSVGDFGLALLLHEMDLVLAGVPVAQCLLLASSAVVPNADASSEYSSHHSRLIHELLSIEDLLRGKGVPVPQHLSSQAIASSMGRALYSYSADMSHLSSDGKPRQGSSPVGQVSAVAALLASLRPDLHPLFLGGYTAAYLAALPARTSVSGTISPGPLSLSPVSPLLPLVSGMTPQARVAGALRVLRTPGVFAAVRGVSRAYVGQVAALVSDVLQGLEGSALLHVIKGSVSASLMEVTILTECLCQVTSNATSNATSASGGVSGSISVDADSVLSVLEGLLPLFRGRRYSYVSSCDAYSAKMLSGVALCCSRLLRHPSCRVVTPMETRVLSLSTSLNRGLFHLLGSSDPVLLGAGQLIGECLVGPLSGIEMPLVRAGAGNRFPPTQSSLSAVQEARQEAEGASEAVGPALSLSVRSVEMPSLSLPEALCVVDDHTVMAPHTHTQTDTDTDADPHTDTDPDPDTDTDADADSVGCVSLPCLPTVQLWQAHLSRLPLLQSHHPLSMLLSLPECCPPFVSTPYPSLGPSIQTTPDAPDAEADADVPSEQQSGSSGSGSQGSQAPRPKGSTVAALDPVLPTSLPILPLCDGGGCPEAMPYGDPDDFSDLAEIPPPTDLRDALRLLRANPDLGAPARQAQLVTLAALPRLIVGCVGPKANKYLDVNGRAFVDSLLRFDNRFAVSGVKQRLTASLSACCLTKPLSIGCYACAQICTSEQLTDYQRLLCADAACDAVQQMRAGREGGHAEALIGGRATCVPVLLLWAGHAAGFVGTARGSDTGSAKAIGQGGSGTLGLGPGDALGLGGDPTRTLFSTRPTVVRGVTKLVLSVVETCVALDRSVQKACTLGMRLCLRLSSLGIGLDLSGPGWGALSSAPPGPPRPLTQEVLQLMGYCLEAGLRHDTMPYLATLAALGRQEGVSLGSVSALYPPELSGLLESDTGTGPVSDREGSEEVGSAPTPGLFDVSFNPSVSVPIVLGAEAQGRVAETGPEAALPYVQFDTQAAAVQTEIERVSDGMDVLLLLTSAISACASGHPSTPTRHTATGVLHVLRGMAGDVSRSVLGDEMGTMLDTLLTQGGGALASLEGSNHL
ncbi:hypothetical protein KIPB_000634 [Kipferlia bialata]|uniref:Uncharacterized protein n=1 Tax=Kipferlia bialata TaxID=797122 RepID=A0A9K3CNW8_9EUKA|nr:hypothetical protein KIPB_000634 [Kipferlia bialata]|eukprot:g634.t1